MSDEEEIVTYSCVQCRRPVTAPLNALRARCRECGMEYAAFLEKYAVPSWLTTRGQDQNKETRHEK